MELVISRLNTGQSGGCDGGKHHISGRQTRTYHLRKSHTCLGPLPAKHLCDTQGTVGGGAGRTTLRVQELQGTTRMRINRLSIVPIDGQPSPED